MCTVSYLPQQNQGFVFTSNRDESPNRSAIELVQKSINDKIILYPKDVKAEGSWIVISNSGQMVCILNGATIKHDYNPPYRMSRGIMALEFFKFESVDDFSQKFEFEGMEPFTMIIYDQSCLFEVRWDGSTLFKKPLNTRNKHIWASSTLYTPEWQQKRKTWFDSWFENEHSPNPKLISDFHHNAGKGDDENALIMNRENRVCTTSITTIVCQKNEMNMNFESIVHHSVLHSKLELSS